MTGFSEADGIEWTTVQMCPAPPGSTFVVDDGDGATVEVACPMFLLQEARRIMVLHFDEDGCHEALEDAEPPFTTRVVPGMLVSYGCGNTEVEPGFAPVALGKPVAKAPLEGLPEGS